MRILLINLMYIGDLLFLTPTIRAIKQAMPDEKIDILIDERYQEIFKYNPLINQLITIDKKGYHNKLFNFIHFIQDIRKIKYDLVINSHANERSSVIAAFSGADQRIGFAAKGFKPFFTHIVKQRTDIHQVEAYLELLRVIGINEFVHNGLEIWIDEESWHKAEILWHEAGLTGVNNVIGLNTGGSWPTKRWTIEGFVNLTEILQKNGFTPIFFGGTMDLEMVNEIVSRLPKNIQPIVFTGRTTLLELAALIRKCRVFVSGDSGPMHIAASQGIPVVALFGPSNPVRYHPYGVPHVVIRTNEPCLACGQHYCKHHRCMTRISSQEVFDAIKSLIVFR